ncbi:MAG: NHL repeat-containing protein [Chloroflexi bacterium]|nr:NHL repeat-containing protein [Chloroflexota bacterium]
MTSNGSNGLEPVEEGGALLRAGFPYVKTVGMRRVTWYPIDVALGDEGRLYCLGRFDAAGLIRVINWDDDDLGGIGSGLVWPSSIIRDHEEVLYVSDEATHTVTVMKRDGEQVAKWGEHGSEPGQLDHPSHMAFDAEEHLWISDAMNHRVQRLSKQGEYISSFGTYGDGEGEFNMPWGIALDAEGCVYVVDWRNDRVQKFTADGEFLMSFGTSGDGDGQFNRPAGIAVDGHGDIYVVDRGNNRVQLFDRSGRYVEQFRGDSTLGKMGRIYILANPKVLRLREMAKLEPQKLFRAPASVRLDNEGHMYVADFGCHRIQIYKKEAYPLTAAEVMPHPGAPSLSTV